LAAADITLHPSDIITIAQKIVSKAENRFFDLTQITPSAAAKDLAEKTGKDARVVTLILQEAARRDDGSAEISRFRQGVLITRHRLGFVSANSGIDRSNVPQSETGEWVLLLPEDPDRSARQIRQSILERTGVAVGVVITDSHGRPHRLGTVGVAIGAAGLPTILDKRGEPDRYGYILHATIIGIADEIAAAASLLMGASTESTPIIHLRGLQLSGDGSAADQYRPRELDLYR
jgi:coenzyme F420-0:L-glutamate ligase/coenzyme F420-1:gamma-L-glutamate ligase